MNDKEKLKILAEAIDKTDCYFTDANGRDFCLFCKCSLNTLHDINCPVLLAEEILKEENKCSNCNGTGNENKEDGTCNHCGGTGTIEPVKGTEPYSEDYLMCNKCDSTFNKDEVIKEHFKRIYALAQEYKEEFLHAINYEQYNLSSKADNPQFTEELFNNIMIDCSICEYMTPHNYLLLTNKMKEKGYIISSKPEESFSKEHMKEMSKSRVDLEKKPMKLYELQHYVDKLIEQGYSDTPVYFDTEAKTYDCHIVPIGSINLVPKEAVGEDHIVLSEYIEKPEEPLIVHNEAE